MNKKQVIVTFILAVLMVLMLFVQKFFDNKFRNITIINNNMGKLEEYYINNGEFSYSLPNSWSVEEMASDQCDISKINFKDSINNIIGSIEFLDNNKDDINVMAEADIKNMILERSEENIENFKLSDKEGIKVKYKTKVNNGYTYINNNYYIPIKENGRIKVTFIVKEDNYTDDITSVFDTIVRSINK